MTIRDADGREWVLTLRAPTREMALAAHVVGAGYFGVPAYRAMLAASPPFKVSDEMVEKAARAICAAEGNDPDAPTEYSGKPRKIVMREGKPMPYWRMHEHDARAALESVLAHD